MNNVVITLDIGATNIKASLISAYNSNIIAKIRTSTIPELSTLKTQINDSIQNLYNNYSSKYNILGIGVSMGGRINFNSGEILYATKNIKNLQGFNIKKFLNSKFSLPVIADNDGNAACWGEYAIRNYSTDNMCCLTLGTGIGGGIIFNGELIRSKTGRAGELGHMIIREGGRKCRCGYLGCWESYAGQYGIKKTAEDFFCSEDYKDLTVKKIYELSDKNESARKVVDITGYYLGLGIKNIIHIFDPDLIVIAGGISAAGNVLLNSIESCLYDDKISHNDVKIELSKSGENVGQIGIKEIFMSEIN